MKKIDDNIEKISLKQSMEEIAFKFLMINIQGKETSLLSYNCKSLIVFISVLVVPIIYFMSVQQYNTDKIKSDKIYVFISVTIIFLSLFLLSIYIYTKIKNLNQFNFLNQFKYNMRLFLLLQINTVGYCSLVTLGTFSRINIFVAFGTVFLYIFLIYKLITIIVKISISKQLNKQYGFEIEIKKWEDKINKFPALVLFLIIFGIQIYRGSKFLFIRSGTNSPIKVDYDLKE